MRMRGKSVNLHQDRIFKTNDMKCTKLTLALLAGAALSTSARADKPFSDTLKLSEAVVTGTRTVADVRQLPFTVSVVDRKELTENYRPSILPTLMEQVPSLMLTSRGMMGYGVSGGAAGGLNMRGISGGAGQLMVLIDGHPQYQGIYGHPISDAYQTLMADRVEVVRGPASMLYGSNAMGGVINIVTRQRQSDGVETNVNVGGGSWGTVQTEASNQVKAGRFSSSVAAQYNRSDNHRDNMGFYQYGGFLKLGYELGSHWNAWLEGDITHFRAQNPGTVTDRLYGAKQWITRGDLSLGFDYKYGTTAGRLSVYDNMGRHKVNDGSDDTAVPQTRQFRSKDALAGASWYQTMQLLEGNHFTMGIDYQHIYGRAYYTELGTNRRIATSNKQSGHSHRNEVAGYADFRQDITPWLTADFGIRVDHHSVSGTEWVPQIGIVTRPLANATLKGMVSKGFRNPTMRELYLYPPSNEELKPERLVNYEISWKHGLRNFSYGVNLFYIKGDNMIQTAYVAGRPRNVNTGEIENSGAEVEASWQATPHLLLTTNHSVLHMVNHVLAAPEYKGYLGATWSQGMWALTAGVQQVAGLFTSVSGNGTRENATLVHATATCHLTKFLDLWAKGDNLLAQKYEFVKGFPMPRATFMGGVNVRF